MEAINRCRILNGNILKIIGLITMTIDHIGLILFPEITILRIIGRLAFPIFAFMISEGAYYTRNKKKYFFLVLLFGIICQLVMYFAAGSLYQSIFITFAFSILIIFCLQRTNELLRNGNQAGGRALGWAVLTLVMIALAVFVCNGLPKLLPETDFAVDYGLWGVMLPVFVYIPNLFMDPKDPRCHLIKLPILAGGLCLIASSLFSIQWWSLFTVILIALYNGKRGKLNLKYLFYFYYPVHLGVLYLIEML